MCVVVVMSAMENVNHQISSPADMIENMASNSDTTSLISFLSLRIEIES
jgi:hypothetical protein